MKRLFFAIILFAFLAPPAHSNVLMLMSAGGFKPVTYSAITGLGISTIAGTAFATCNSGTCSNIPWAQYLNRSVTISDNGTGCASDHVTTWSSGTTYACWVTGYVKGAGRGETYGSNLILNGQDWSNPTNGLAQYWTTGGETTPALFSIVTGNGFTGNAQQAQYHTGESDAVSRIFSQAVTYNIFTNSVLYYISGMYRSSVSFYTTELDTIISTFPANTGNATPFSCYRTSTSATYRSYSMRIYATVVGDYFQVDNVFTGQVLTPSTTGVTLSSTRGGATQSFSNVPSGFNPNSTNITVTVGP